MSRRSLLKKENGNVLLIVAVVMGVVVVCLLVAIDFANYFITKSRLQSIADLSAEAGASVISEEAVKIAQIRAAEYETPPSNDPLYYLRDGDRAFLLYDPGVVSTVKKVMSNNRSENLKFNSKLSSSEFKFLYPLNNPRPSCTNRGLMAAVKTEISYALPLIFPASQKIFNRNTIEVKTESISRVQLCSN